MSNVSLSPKGFMKNIFKGINYEKVPLFLRRFINSLLGFFLIKSSYKKMKIIGVTGTSGKTTTTTLLYNIAMTLGHKAGLIGTVENFVNGKSINDFPKKEASSVFDKIFFSSTSTTPEVWQLAKLLSKMESEGCEYVFMEVSSHGLEEKRVSRLKFAGAIFTNLSHDHLDFHKTMQNYFKAKKKLFDMLPPKVFALSNADDAYGLDIVSGSKAQQIFYGFLGHEDFHGDILKSGAAGLELSINGHNIKSKLFGKFNAFNLLAVWSACKLLGFDMEKVKKILENIEPPPGRFDHFLLPNGVMVVVDYAHKPDALKNVLLTSQDIKSKNGRIISVFGCGGDRDQSKRPIMGKIGASLSDIAIFTSDNPRNEDPEKIIEQMKHDLTPVELKKVISIVDRHLAIAESLKLAKAGDIILCAGFGHDRYQEIKGVKSYFNETEEFTKNFRK